MIAHTFPPLYDINLNILILGSFPSVKMRWLYTYAIAIGMVTG